MNKNLNDYYVAWQVVEEQVQRSSIKRIKYKALFGRTLTNYITSLKSEGFTSSQTIHIILGHLRALRCDTPELVRRISISVAARYAEQHSLEKQTRKKE